VSDLVICGGSIAGLSTAILLARDGHTVTVLERDAAPAPGDAAQAWDAWDRKGVAQFHQPHNLFPRSRVIWDEEMPEINQRFTDAGMVWGNPLESMPPIIQDTAPRPDDDKFRGVTGRRPVIEAVLAQAAAEQPGVTIRRGVGVAELLTGPSAADRVPHVRGVRTTDGDELTADLVIDAMGRRTPLADWLAALGTTPPQVESDDCGFVYYTQYFQGPNLPTAFGPPVVPMGTFTILTLPGDNGTWSVTLFGSSKDAPLKALKDPETFAKVVKACPMQAHWLGGTPITEVLPMAGILDKYRRFVVDGRPVATGVAAVGDAWACTNPSAGRGMSVGLIHAQQLRNVVRAGLDDPVAFALAFDDVTEQHVAPFYWNQVAMDRARIAEMDALRAGLEPPAPDPTSIALQTAMLYDPDVFRGVLETITCLALPDEVWARPGFAEKVDAARDNEPFPIPTPTREQLLDLVG
jgi:2-polyprenyl-6-methoxyphenol hydroxylase-like FAD-dependent oxidoreductase